MRVKESHEKELKQFELIPLAIYLLYLFISINVYISHYFAIYK